jgi:hypothetical protein
MYLIEMAFWKSMIFVIIPFLNKFNAINSFFKTKPFIKINYNVPVSYVVNIIEIHLPKYMFICGRWNVEAGLSP